MFLNAGDTFPTRDTLEIIKKEIEENNNPDFIYGDSM